MKVKQMMRVLQKDSGKGVDADLSKDQFVELLVRAKFRTAHREQSANKTKQTEDCGEITPTHDHYMPEPHYTNW
jgi:hypothetical protein